MSPLVLILLVVVVLALLYGSWGGRGPYPERYHYGTPWVFIILVIALLLYLVGGLPLNLVCLYVALIFAIMLMVGVPSPNLSLLGACLTFVILSWLVGSGGEWHGESMRLFHR
jgi:chromate transport protein ChrA